MFFDITKHPVIVALFGVSSFAVFAMPRRDIGRSRNIIGGYAICIAIGSIAHYFLMSLSIGSYTLQKIAYMLTGGLAISIGMFIPAVTAAEHAPADGYRSGAHHK